MNLPVLADRAVSRRLDLSRLRAVLQSSRLRGALSFKWRSEIPLCIGLVGFLVYLAFYCHNCWVIIQHCGGLLEAMHDFYGTN